MYECIINHIAPFMVSLRLKISFTEIEAFSPLNYWLLFTSLEPYLDIDYIGLLSNILEFLRLKVAVEEVAYLLLTDRLLFLKSAALELLGIGGLLTEAGFCFQSLIP